MRPRDTRPPKAGPRRGGKRLSGKATGGWGWGSANLTFAIFLAVFFSLIGGGVWWNVNRLQQQRTAAAEAAPRMTCSFDQWCVAGDCDVAVPADFLIITRGTFDRSYLRMEGRGGQVRAPFVEARDPEMWREYLQWSPERGEILIGLTEALDFTFTYDVQEGQEADIAEGPARGTGTCDWIVEEAA